MNKIVPVVGDWYRAANGDLLEVVAIDGDDDTIEIQYFDGTLEEFDQESWDAQVLAEADAPEDWTGPLDVDEEDVEPEDEAPQAPVWSAPSEFLDRNETSGYSEWPQATDDSAR
jgi:hypothetical protein